MSRRAKPGAEAGGQAEDHRGGAAGPSSDPSPIIEVENRAFSSATRNPVVQRNFWVPFVPVPSKWINLGTEIS